MARHLIRKEEGIFIYQIGNGERFAVRMEHQGRDLRKFGFTAISKARHWRDTRKGRALEGKLFPEEERKREVEEGRKREAEEGRKRQMAEAYAALTLRAYADTWMKAKRASGLKHTTLLRYDSILRVHVWPVFGSLPLAEVNRAKVRELVGSLSDSGRKPKTIKNVLSCLSALYTDAIEDGHVQHNPALKTSKLIKTGKRGEDMDTFNHEEECRVLQKAQEKCPHYYPFILLLFRTGMREGEAFALRPEVTGPPQAVRVDSTQFHGGAIIEHPEEPPEKKSGSGVRPDDRVERLSGGPGRRSHAPPSTVWGMAVYHTRRGNDSFE